MTGSITTPSSGIRAWYPSCTPTGAVMERVNHGLLRCSTEWAIHQKSHTYVPASRVACSFPSVSQVARGQVTATPAAR